jgi:hypothetical protein
MHPDASNHGAEDVDLNRTINIDRPSVLRPFLVFGLLAVLLGAAIPARALGLPGGFIQSAGPACEQNLTPDIGYDYDPCRLTHQVSGAELPAVEVGTMFES